MENLCICVTCVCSQRIVNRDTALDIWHVPPLARFENVSCVSNAELSTTYVS